MFNTLFWVVALTGALPYLFARETMNPSVAVATAAHLLLGSLLSLSLFRFVLAFRRSNARVDGYGLAAVLIAASAMTGTTLLLVALCGRSIGPLRGIYLGHVAVGFIAIALAVTSLRRLPRLPRTVPRAGPAVTITGLLLAGGALAASTYAAESYFSELTAITAAQAHNPLFPAGTRIAAGSPWASAPSAESCAASGCHPAVVHDWSTSIHAHADSHTEYQAALRASARQLPPNGTRWCAGCHAPISLAAAGPTAKTVESETSNPQARFRNSQSAIRNPHSSGCLSCHAMAAVPDAFGNGKAEYRAPQTYPFEGSRGGTEQWAHGLLLRVRPAPHRASYAGPRGSPLPSAMCLPCHQLSVNVAQNGYKFLPYDETWSDWLASPWSGDSAHTFRDVPARQGCADCHMRADVRGATSHQDSHARAAPVTVEVFALRRQRAANEPIRVDAPLTRARPVLVAGESAAVDVLVENRSIGHSFPSGLPSAFDWRLEMTVTDAAGRPVAAEENAGDTAHTYGLIALNRAGSAVGVDDFYTMVAPVLNRSIPAGEAETVRFRFTAPPAASGPLRLTATLRHRNEVLATHVVELIVSAPNPRIHASGPPADDPRDSGRFFAYGVGLLRPSAPAPQIAEARAALLTATALQPSNPDFLTALGRAFLAEGDLLSARARLEQALKLNPRSPRARAYLGATLLRMGQPELAIALLAPLASEFPRDRLLWLDIGLAHFKSARYQQAVDAFNRALEVAPSDASAHYNLMRCYAALNRLTEARREEAIFHAIQDDEPLTALVEPFLQSHPRLRREAQSMHTHVLEAAR